MPPRSKRHLVPAMLAVALAASFVYVAASAAPPDGTGLASEACEPSSDGSTTTTTRGDGTTPTTADGDDPTTTTGDDDNRRGRRSGRMTGAAAAEEPSATTTTAGGSESTTTTAPSDPTTTTSGPSTTTTAAPESTTTTSTDTTTTTTAPEPTTTTTVPVGASTTTTTGGGGSTTTTTVVDPEPCPATTTTTTTAPASTTTTSRPARTTTTTSVPRSTTTTTRPSSGGPILGGEPGPAGGPSGGSDGSPPAGSDGSVEETPGPVVFERQDPVPDQDLSAWVPPVFEEMADPQAQPGVVVAQAVDDVAPDPRARGRQRARGERVAAPAEEFTPTAPPLSYPQFVPDRSVVGSLPGRIDYPLPHGATTEAALGGVLRGPGGGMPNRRGPALASTILVALGWASHSVLAWRRRPRYQPA